MYNQSIPLQKKGNIIGVGLYNLTSINYLCAYFSGSPLKKGVSLVSDTSKAK